MRTVTLFDICKIGILHELVLLLIPSIRQRYLGAVPTVVIECTLVQQCDTSRTKERKERIENIFITFCRNIWSKFVHYTILLIGAVELARLFAFQ